MRGGDECSQKSLEYCGWEIRSRQTEAPEDSREQFEPLTEGSPVSADPFDRGFNLLIFMPGFFVKHKASLRTLFSLVLLFLFLFLVDKGALQVFVLGNMEESGCFF